MYYGNFKEYHGRDRVGDGGGSQISLESILSFRNSSGKFKEH